MTTIKKKNLSDVEVTFMDGEVKTYRITASTSIGGYLMAQASQTGILHLFSDDESHSIPMVNIREWSIKAVYTEDAEDAEANGDEQ